MLGNGNVQAFVEFFVDIAQGRRDTNASLHRKGESVSLSSTVVGILSKNDHFDLIKGSGVEGVEDH